ncbi:MAG: hypothetical protein HZC54_14200 [Verrucomicrobia bacterium]|nr:hypothetical protein [Verrucomicrobiota bacterium]
MRLAWVIINVEKARSKRWKSEIPLIPAVVIVFGLTKAPHAVERAGLAAFGGLMA